MPTNSKTPNLKLNQWESTDKPMRLDFVEDNAKIDAAVSAHIADAAAHLTDEEHQRLTEPFVVGLLAGSGEASAPQVLPFAPSLVLVYLRNSPLYSYHGDGYVVCSCAVATTKSASGGAALSGSTLTLSQTQGAPGDGVFYNLNKNGGQYQYVAFR